jgi:ABC-type transport system involved in multi-copper enzyme maturation permease subunit
MIAIARAQLQSQRRLSSLATAVAAIFVTSLIVVLTIATTSTDGKTSAGRGGAAGTTLAELASSHGLAHELQQATPLLGVIALAYMASVFAQDFSTGVIRNLLLREPRRMRLMLGKLVGQAAAVAVVAALAGLVAVAFAYAAAGDKGIDTSLWLSTGLGRSLAAWLGLTASTLGWALTGAALGLLFRSGALAIGLGLAYAVAFENILSAVWNTGKQWLLGRALTAIAGGGSITVARALILSAFYLVLLLAVAVSRFRRDDVTA